MQNKKILIIVILIVGLGLIISNYVGLFGEDYGTGLNINTTTQKFEHYGHYEGKNKKFLYTQDYEMLGEVYIASWQPQGKSTTISAVAKFNFRQYFHWTGSPIFILGQYVWMVYYEDPNKNMHLIIDGIHNHIDTDYVVDVTGEIQGDLPNMIYKPTSELPVAWANPPSNSWGANTWTWYPTDKWRSMSTGSISFKIKGNRIGAIRVYCLLEFAELYSTWTGLGWAGSNLLVVEDWAYLAPGIGRVDVLGVNSIRQDGTTRTIPTNREVPLYVFEEGSTVVFTVDTGYAGAMTGEKGWRLAVYKSDQTQPLKTWWLDDDLRNYHIEWTIPKGTWTPGGENELTVVLTNTIIDQAERTFFVVDNISKIPGTPQILIEKYEYNQGEEVEVTLRAEANPNGTGDIAEFRVQVKWDRPDSTDYILDKKFPAYHIEGLTYGTSFSFVVDRPDRYFYILAHAVDSEGRKSGEATREGYVKQTYGNLKLTVFVKETDETPISGAKITIGGQTGYTSTDGKATFWLPSGTYQITVEKAGYNTYRGQVVMNKDKTIEIILIPSILPPEGWAMYLVIAVALAVLIYVGVVIYKKYRHR